MKNKAESRSSRFSRSARLTGLFALFILLLGVGQLLYRFNLPTDGWSVYTEEIDETTFIFDKNLVGAPSRLIYADNILQVNGIQVAGTATSSYIQAPPGWQIGQEVSMLVRRGAEQIEVAVPVVGWTAAALTIYNVTILDHLAGLLGGLLMLGLGWFTFLRRPEIPSARALLILCTAVGVAAISGMLPDGLSVQFNQTAFWLTIFFSYAIFGTLLAPALLVFTLLFPKPKRIVTNHPWLALMPFIYGLLLLIFLISGGPAEVGWLSTLAMFVLSLASLIHAGFTQRDAVSKAQLRWVVSSFVLGLGLFMLNFPMAFGLISNVTIISAIIFLQGFAMVIIGIGMAIAILRYRLFDIDVIIRKTLVYTVLTVILALVYFGAVILLQSIFESISGEQSPIAIVISTLVIAALFAPLRRRVQEVIDRRFFRKKYNAQQVLMQFSKVAREEMDIDELTAELIRVLQEAIEPETLNLWLIRQNH